jgi:hypothetical protein
LEPVQELVEVSGTVLSNKGKPVPGETVQFYSEAARQRYSAVSDRNGAFWIDEVETSSDYLLAVHPRDKWRDFTRHGVEIALGGADLEVVLEPLNLGSLTGQMVDPTGQPVPQFSLWLRNPGALNQPALLVTGDGQGYFRVDEIEAGALIFETRSSPLYRISGIHLSAGEKKDVRLRHGPTRNRLRTFCYLVPALQRLAGACGPQGHHRRGGLLPVHPGGPGLPHHPYRCPGI